MGMRWLKTIGIILLVIIGIIMIVNNKKIMKGYKTSVLVKIGLYASLLFALIISYNGIVALTEYF